MATLKQVIRKINNKPAAALLVLLVVFGLTSVLSAGKDESSKRGFLGVNIERMNAEEKDEFNVKFGILVSNVIKGEAAEKAGIKKYDVIQYINGERMRRPDDLTEAVGNQKPGSKIDIKLVREGSEKAISAVLGEAKHEEHQFSWSGKDFPKHIMPGLSDKYHKKIIISGDKDGTIFMCGGGFLGVNLQSLKNKDFAEYFGVTNGAGALITSIQDETPAQKAGLKAGDVIVKIDDKDMDGPADVSKYLSKKEKGDKVAVTVMRHKNKKTVNAELAGQKTMNYKFFSDRGGDHDIRIHVPDVDVNSDEDLIIIDEHDGKVIKKKLKKIEEKEKKLLKKTTESSQM